MPEQLRCPGMYRIVTWLIIRMKSRAKKIKYFNHELRNCLQNGSWLIVSQDQLVESACPWHGTQNPGAINLRWVNAIEAVSNDIYNSILMKKKWCTQLIFVMVFHYYRKYHIHEISNALRALLICHPTRSQIALNNLTSRYLSVITPW